MPRIIRGLADDVDIMFLIEGPSEPTIRSRGRPMGVNSMNKVVHPLFLSLRLITTMLLVLISAGCSFLVSYESPYKGRVIDAETKQPIEGVVVLGVWYSESPTIAGVVGKYFDAKETVTDKQGEFEIKGQGLRVFSSLSGMHVLIFKAGYKYIGMGPWESFKLDPMFKNEIAWEGNKVIVSIRKLTKEERNSSETFPSSPPAQASAEKIRLMMKEIHRERTERGLN